MLIVLTTSALTLANLILLLHHQDSILGVMLIQNYLKTSWVKHTFNKESNQLVPDSISLLMLIIIRINQIFSFKVELIL
jgi:thiazole synthase ThiGH ThiG subunit